MKSKRFILIAWWLIFSLAAIAENKLYINDFSATQGEQVTIPVNMQNEDQISAFQFDLVLPSNVFLDGVCVSTSRILPYEYEVYTNNLADGSIRIACLSINDAEGAYISGTDGKVLMLTLNIPREFNPDTMSVYLNNQIFAKQNLTETSFSTNEAYMYVVHKSNMSSNNTLHIDNIETNAGNQLQLPIQMQNEASISALQFDLVLPEGVTIAEDEDGYALIELGRTTAKKHNTLETSTPSAGVTRVMCASTSNAVFSGNSGVVLTICLNVASTLSEGTYTVQMKNITLSTAESVIYEPTDITATLTIGNGTEPTISVTSITLDNASASINEGETLTLIASVLPLNATNATITWTSSNTNVATVSNGVITAISAGAAIITATAADGSGISTSCSVIVSRAAEPESGNTLFIDNIATNAGNQLQLPIQMQNEASISALQFDLVLPEGVTIAEDEDGYALIELGRTTAKKHNTLETSTPSAGVTRVMCASTSNAVFSGNSGTVLTISLNVASTLPEGNYSIQMKNITLSTAESVIYEPADVAATLTIGSNTEPTISVTSITLDNTSASLTEGETLILIASVLPTNATNATITWTSSDIDVATVDENGNITAVSAGTATITATAADGSGVSASCIITVSEPSPSVEPSTDISILANTIYIPDMEEKTGASFQLPIYLKNAEENIIGFQFDLYIPDGIVLEKNARDKVKAPTFNAEADRTSSEYHTISAAEQEDGAIRVLCYSNDNELILDTDGIVCDFNATVSEDMAEGDYNIIIRNICLTKSDITEVNIDKIVSLFTVPSYILGDVNDDKKVTVTDIACTASYILGTTPEPFIFKAADVNTDERITVTDIAGIANIILTGGSSSAKSRTAKFASKSANPSLEIVPFTVASGATSESVPLELISEKEDEFVGFQCDICLPEGISWEKNKRGKLSAPTFNAAADRTSSEYHTVSAAAQEDGSIRVLCYSTENWEILGKEGAVIDMPLVFDENIVPGIYDIIIRNVELTNTDIESVNPAEYKVSVLVGSPDMASIALSGDFTADAIAEYNTALADNKAIAAVDLTGACSIDGKKAFAFGNRNLLVYTAEGQTVANEVNVVKGEECDKLVITDGDSFNAPKAFKAMNASYGRAMTNALGTICLPYAVSSDENIQYYQLTGADLDKGTLTFDEVSGLEANQPGLFQKLGEGDLAVNVSNAEVIPAEDMTVENCGWTLNGVLENTVISKDLFADKDYYYIASGKFCPVIETKNLTVGAFRAYFTTNGSSNVKSFSIAIGNETAITNVSIDEAVNDKAYNVAGLPVNGNYKGLVIKNGKKYLNK